MNRLDMTQMQVPQADARVAALMIWGTYITSGLAVLLAAVWGVSDGTNPTDQAFSVMSRLPALLLMVDAWAVLVAFTRHNASTPLRIPYKTPCILAAIHAVAALGCAHLIGFDVLYALSWVDGHSGHYVIRWGIGAAIVVLSFVSLLVAGFETRLVRWVLLSEITSVGATAEHRSVSETEDIELGSEHVYEAQVLLNNLGYDVTQISGELNGATVDCLRIFQESVHLEASGKLTGKSMIELRNQWREREGETSLAMAVSGHAVRRTGSRIARFFRRS